MGSTINNDVCLQVWILHICQSERSAHGMIFERSCLLLELITRIKEMVLMWIPGHVGTAGDECVRTRKGRDRRTLKKSKRWENIVKEWSEGRGAALGCTYDEETSTWLKQFL